ncbi:MAG: type II secretion system protein [Candidatus Marinimicrobia bacterium]|nr:type II secretion system protein [Candidatus Neomarinimicrobiota bacterium]MBT4359399.1 type II secretion system protein [Candidatus Neomarinimicrobiota bacterium]MBT4715415.1 type II secretion system protein [Candidatus Neomarinimicrobiota bacterium]MBT4944555.1 type II secretion system protein [Candidatus Neomarinimicrobiota bacterium]MBT5268827.1 type II secretion system protein [Candidatus Neomarinimicrobiota bacterium]
MKTNNNKGFTLIELIMVIVILGILAAVAVPKFFSMTDQAHVKNKAAVIGNVRSGMNLLAANRLVRNGDRDLTDLENLATWADSVLDEKPDGWTFKAGSAAAADTIIYDHDNTTYLVTFPATGGYTIN